VLFHDGQELSAHDVVHTITRQLSPRRTETSLAYSYLLVIAGAAEFAHGESEQVSGLEVVDERTLRVRLVHPYPSFLEVLAMDNLGVVPHALVDGRGDEAFGRAPVGTGPFRLAGWHDDKIVLEANSSYFAGRPYLDSVEISLLREGDKDTGATRFAEEAIDVLEAPSDVLPALAADETVELYRYQELSLSFLGLNAAAPPLDDLDVRRAIAHAIDRQALVNESPGVRREAVGVLPPGLSGYSPELKALAYDPQEARRLLIAAGHPDGQGLPSIELASASKSASAQRVTQQIRDDLAEVGIRVELVPVSWAEMGDRLSNGTAGMFLLGWVADLTDPDSFLRSLFETGGSGNYFRYASRATEQLLESGMQQANPVERARIYRELERQVLDQAPLVPLYHTVGVVAVRHGVQGFRPTPLGVAKVDLEKVWFHSPDRPS
jgi:ABC-type transport system substrate-binding protein